MGCRVGWAVGGGHRVIDDPMVLSVSGCCDSDVTGVCLSGAVQLVGARLPSAN